MSSMTTHSFDINESLKIDKIDNYLSGTGILSNNLAVVVISKFGSNIGIFVSCCYYKIT